jgi:tRNA pseudouridine38-40 synthase
MGPFRIVALWCWYRGAGFRGYQHQQGLRTVQGELLRAFSLAGLSRNPVVAGRTDRGVSARMQVLSARLERDQHAESLVKRLNALLPDDLRVHVAREARPGFHAAWSSTTKEYRYALDAAAIGDLERLRELAALVPGTRNFKVFHFKTSQEQPRTVRSVELLETPQGVTLRFVGEGFARHMVRMLVGGLTAVSHGVVTREQFVAGLETQKNFNCPTAPAEPLTLWDVGYPPDVDPFTEAERAAFAWEAFSQSAPD